MSYRFEKDQPVALAVRRIVQEEIASARERLKGGRVQDRDVAIHEVRKSVKKVRGMLRLMQPALGQTYDQEIEAWREIGRKLSPLRDAGVMIGVFDDIRDRFEKQLAAPLGTNIRNNLVLTKRELEKPVATAGVVVAVTGGLKSAERRLKKWPLTGEGFPAIGAGLQRTYKRGKKALRLAARNPSAENLHDLRKRAKEYLYQMRLMEDMWDGHLRRHEERVGKLEEILGEHHNLAVLKINILGQTQAPGNSTDIERFLDFIDRLEMKLARRALKLGSQVYRDSSGQVAGRLEKLWNHWAIS